MRSSFLAKALWLSLVQTGVDARAMPQNGKQLQEDESAQSSTNVSNWFGKIFKKNIETRATCDKDRWYDFVDNSTFGQSLCQALISYPEQTVIDPPLTSNHEVGNSPWPRYAIDGGVRLMVGSDW